MLATAEPIDIWFSLTVKLLAELITGLITWATVAIVSASPPPPPPPHAFIKINESNASHCLRLFIFSFD